MAFDFILTRNELIARAFRKLGVLAPGQTLTADQLAQGLESLNAVVQDWTNDHIFLFTQEAKTRVLIPTQPKVSLNIDGLIDIDCVKLREDEDTALERILFEDYMSILSKDDAGDPVCYAVDYRTMSVYLYPTPTTADTLYFRAIKKLSDWDEAAGSGDFSAAWQQAITYAVAADLAPEYSIPPGEQDRLERRALAYYRKAKGNDVEREDSSTVKGAFD